MHSQITFLTGIPAIKIVRSVMDYLCRLSIGASGFIRLLVVRLSSDRGIHVQYWLKLGFCQEAGQFERISFLLTTSAKWFYALGTSQKTYGHL